MGSFLSVQPDPEKEEKQPIEKEIGILYFKALSQYLMKELILLIFDYIDVGVSPTRRIMVRQKIEYYDFQFMEIQENFFRKENLPCFYTPFSNVPKSSYYLYAGNKLNIFVKTYWFFFFVF